MANLPRIALTGATWGGVEIAPEGTEVLLDRFPGLALVDEQAARPAGTTIRGAAALPVRL